MHLQGEALPLPDGGLLLQLVQRAPEGAAAGLRRHGRAVLSGAPTHLALLVGCRVWGLGSMGELFSQVRPHILPTQQGAGFGV